MFRTSSLTVKINKRNPHHDSKNTESHLVDNNFYSKFLFLYRNSPFNIVKLTWWFLWDFFSMSFVEKWKNTSRIWTTSISFRHIGSTWETGRDYRMKSRQICHQSHSTHRFKMADSYRRSSRCGSTAIEIEEKCKLFGNIYMKIRIKR